MHDTTTADQLTTADLGRPIAYTYGDTTHTIRVGTDLTRVEYDGAHYIEIADGHIVRTPMIIDLLPDDRVHDAGLYPDMDEDTYHGDPLKHLGGSLSASMCKVLNQPGGEAKLRWQLDHPPESKAVFEFGKAAHSLVLGAGAELVSIPGHRGKDDVKAAIADAKVAGKIALKPDEYDQVHRMADALRGHQQASELLDGITPEASAFRKHETGTWLRSRFDGIGETYVLDYKTARSADAETFARDAFRYGYHLQAAAYLAMADELLKREHSFYFIAQEKTAPYLPSVLEMSKDWLTQGRDDYELAIEIWNRCQRLDEWPGYPDEIQTILPPVWATGDEEEMEVAA